MISSSVVRVCIHDFAQEFDLVSCGFGIPTRGFDDLESGVTFGTKITGESVPSAFVVIPPR